MTDLVERLRDPTHGFDRNGSHSEDRYICLCDHLATEAADEIERLQSQLADATHVLSLCAFALRQPFDDWKGVHEANALNAINDFCRSAVARKEKL